MTPFVVVREAGSADEDVVGRLDEAARLEAHSHRGADHLLDSLGTFSARWGRRETEFLFHVATVSDEVVGFSVVRLLQRPMLDQVYVDQSARGLGVGAALLRSAVDRHGASRLDALSLPGDRLTKNLYERAGLKARLIVASAL
ncbi:MAG: N-acetyltransferase family protein [Ilumatobacteraceae bacterium]|jgi:GNAT superfamily N-acetyltransferase